MKNSYFRKNLLVWLLSLSLVLAGCAQPHYQAAPWETIRPGMGTVGVVAAEFEPARSFEGYARGRLSGAGRGAVLAPLSFMTASGGGNDPFMLVFLPPLAVIGAVSGAVVADPKEVILASEAEAREALAALRIQRSLQELVIEHAHRETPHTIVLMPASSPDFLEEPRSHSDMAAESTVDTVLELAVLRIGSKGPGINAPVALFLIAQARLLSAHDGLLLFEGNYTFTSERRKFTQWCADHAVLLSDAYSRGLNDLAGQIVDDLFLSLSLDEVGQLQVIEPSGRFGRKKVYSLQPTFAWESFPRPEDQSWIGGREIMNVTYELRIIRLDEPGFPERVVEQRGLSSSVHVLEAPLAPKSKYSWMVRSRFEIQGEVRVTEWSTPVRFKTPRLRE